MSNPDRDPWFNSDEWKDFSQAINAPIVQRGMSKIIMGGLPVGVPGTAEQESLKGAERRGFFNFYREIIKLTVLPQKAETRPMAHHLTPDPLQEPQP